MDNELARKLIGELLDVKDMLLVIDSNGAVGELHARNMRPIEFDSRWATIESQDWHIHLDLQAVDGAQFVVNSDHGHEAMPKLYYLRLSDADGGTLLRFYFPNPWLDDEENPAPFQPERVQAFSDFCARYAEKDGVEFVERTPEGDVFHADGILPLK